mmetsp:Transcript_9647/g.28855  ORF Transcript_9647/g.28855 Transcript_9647/m.28855 type:complete len:380 (+) Transcript_9647:191-1330(+)
MADIKNIFGESDSEDEGDAPADVGALFALSDDEEEEAPIQRRRLQKGPAEPKKKAAEDAAGAYDSEEEEEETDADRAFIDADGDDKELLAEYAAAKQDFRGDRPAADAEDGFEARDKPKPKARDADNPMAPTLERMKRKRRKELQTDEKDKIVGALLTRMDTALKEDAAAVEEGRPATAKVRLLPLVGRVFKQLALRQTLLDFDALDLVRLWLDPAADGTRPQLAIRQGLLDAMKDLPAQPEHLKRSKVGVVVMKMANDSGETRENRQKARRLVEAWARPIVGKASDMKGLKHATAQRFKRPVEGITAAPDERRDDAQTIFDANAEDAKKHARVRVPQFGGFDFTVRPLSTADPAQAKKKAAPDVDTAKGRLVKKVKRR